MSRTEKAEIMRKWMRDRISDAISEDSSNQIAVGFITAKEKPVFKVVSKTRTQWFEELPIPFSMREVTKELLESLYSNEKASKKWNGKLLQFIFKER